MHPVQSRASRGASSTPRLLLLLILSISAFIQFTVVSRTVVDHPLRADSHQYFSYAYNLTHYGVYSMTPTWATRSAVKVPVPDSHRPPGYPLFLAMLGNPTPTGGYLIRVSLAQAALGVFSVWLVYLIALSFLGTKWSLAVALLTAISPHLAIISTNLLSESLFFFLLMASVLSLIRAISKSSRWLYVVTGVLWGLCSLVRSTTEFLPLLLLVLVFAVPRLRRFRLSGALAFLCFALVLTPWKIRNQSDAVRGSGPSLMVLTLAHGSYPDFMYQGQPHSFGFPYRFDPDAEKNSRDLPSILGHIAGRFRAEPFTYIRWYAFGKPAFFLAWGNVQGWDILIHPILHTPYAEDIRFELIRMLALLLHWPLMILGLGGTTLVLLRPGWLGLDVPGRAAAMIVALVVAYALAFHILAAPFPRYGVPFRPLLYALAMLPLRTAWESWRERKAGNPAPNVTASVSK